MNCCTLGTEQSRRHTDHSRLPSCLFLTREQSGSGNSCVRWQGRDAEGRPILVVRVAQACLECSSTRAELLGQAILSQLDSTDARYDVPGVGQKGLWSLIEQ
ncbi:hypothetical protein WJX79_000084 [Trebouxia sp. C0005]